MVLRDDITCDLVSVLLKILLYINVSMSTSE